VDRPWFQNGSIANTHALETVLESYRALSGEENLSIDTWESTFGYVGATFDLNYAPRDQLLLLYPDYPESVIEKIAAHEERYEKPDDFPIDDEYKMTLLEPRLGMTPVLSSAAMTVSVDFNTTQECSGSLSFRMGLKKKKITHLTLSPIVCP
jgi:hypothetical protein